ncbi:MAG: endonuclease III domain-containing protein, partial [Candidatus Kapaibacteriota bacterium]
TKSLFKKYKKPEDFATIDQAELEKLIFSTGYYKSKAKHIIQCSNLILQDYNGEVPNTMEDLLKLPGVGRKTANVILSHSFNKPGIVVDTHVIRITNRLGIVNTRNPKKIELELMNLLPIEKWVIFTHLMIAHGRKYCSSRKPKCLECPIQRFCEYNASRV